MPMNRGKTCHTWGGNRNLKHKEREGTTLDGNTSALATYLVALAILESNGKTYVSREIREAIEQLKIELGLR